MIEVLQTRILAYRYEVFLFLCKQPALRNVHIHSRACDGLVIGLCFANCCFCSVLTKKQVPFDKPSFEVCGSLVLTNQHSFLPVNKRTASRNSALLPRVSFVLSLFRCFSKELHKQIYCFHSEKSTLKKTQF